jgi:hypothetical protein
MIMVVPDSGDLLFRGGRREGKKHATFGTIGPCRRILLCGTELSRQPWDGTALTAGPRECRRSAFLHTRWRLTGGVVPRASATVREKLVRPSRPWRASLSPVRLIPVCKIRMNGPEESLHRFMQTMVNWLRSCGFDQPSIMWHMCCLTHGVTNAGQIH